MLDESGRLRKEWDKDFVGSLEPIGKKVLSAGIEKANQQYNWNHAVTYSDAPHLSAMQRAILQQAEAQAKAGQERNRLQRP